MSRFEVAPFGTDGKPMTNWQIWLRRLCVAVIVWASAELFIGFVIFVIAQFVSNEVFNSFVGVGGLIPTQESWALLGVYALIGAFLNVVIAFLGIRGAENPKKITLFFWIALIDAVITAWSIASNVSNGLIDPAGIVSGLFIIALAVCAWQVRKQTGYFDRHP